MAQGIELPLKAVNGRLKLLSGDAYIEQLVRTSLGSNESDNPFQNIGLGEFMIFEINDELTEGVIRQRIQRVFESLEADQLARMLSLSFTSEGADKNMLVSYENLETGHRRELEVPIGEQ